MWLTDLILVIHAVIIAFVIVGLVLIVIGGIRHWHWTTNPWFRLIHLLIIAIVAAQAWFDRICPLTQWEGRLREANGGPGYGESFIQYWLHKIVFYDFPPWVFTAAYTAFGILVLAAWVLVPPRRSTSGRRRGDTLAFRRHL